jgi:serine/threonine protein phosphatase PrpC
MKKKHFSNGSTAVCCLFDTKQKRIFIFHTGDSKVVAFRNQLPQDVAHENVKRQMMYISTDHSLYVPEERARVDAISKKAPQIEARNGRIYLEDTSSLNVARSFGDHDFKLIKGVELKDQAISPKPDVYVVKLDEKIPEHGIGIAMATDGIWASSITGKSAAAQTPYIEDQTAVWVMSETRLTNRYSDFVGRFLDNVTAVMFSQRKKTTDNTSMLVITVKPI